MIKRTQRRTFLKQAATVGIAAPFFVRNLRSAPPNSVVRHASFGASGMAGSDWSHIVGHKSVKFVSVAEVDTARAEGVNKKYPDGSVKVYQDWREMLDKEHKNLDS